MILHVEGLPCYVLCGSFRLQYLVLTMVCVVPDPKIGQATGFGGVILHGLGTFGFAARAVVSAVGGNDPSSLKFFGVRFSSPVKPGDELETSMWEVGAGPDGTIELAFVTKDLNSGKVCLSNGIAYVKRAEKSKL